VFMHGLRRPSEKVWMSSGSPPESWPQWLNSDVDNLSIWSLEYDSAPTRWRGYSMARADRANNILARLLSEEKLKQGDIAFVVHSFGGLIFEHMLRLANERAPAEPHVADFLKRISRVTFLGTPHRGARLATWGGKLRLIARPSLAAQGLERNDPDLRDLNQFYRGFATQNGIDTQRLVETRPTRWLGQIVEPDSSDVGLTSAPIPVDADHYSIASPDSRESEVYIHIRNQLKKPIRPRKTIVDPSTIEGIAKDTSTNTATLTRIEQQLSATRSPTQAASSVPRFLVDEEIRKRVSRLRRMRFFVGSTHLEESSQLAQDLLTGQLSGA
jgi:pimeloyl-ACP methyl ester carboxylesterase